MLRVGAMSREHCALLLLGAMFEKPRGGKRRRHDGAGRDDAGVPEGQLISMRAAVRRCPGISAEFSGAYRAMVDCFWELTRAWDRMSEV